MNNNEQIILEEVIAKAKELRMRADNNALNTSPISDEDWEDYFQSYFGLLNFAHQTIPTWVKQSLEEAIKLSFTLSEEDALDQQAILAAHNITYDKGYYWCNDGDGMQSIWKALEHTIWLDLMVCDAETYHELIQRATGFEDKKAERKVLSELPKDPKQILREIVAIWHKQQPHKKTLEELLKPIQEAEMVIE